MPWVDVTGNTPAPATEIPPTPTPPRNGRILLMSAQEPSSLWSIEPDGSNPVRIGESLDIDSMFYRNATESASKWVSPNKQHIVYFDEEGVGYLARVDGTIVPIRLGKIDSGQWQDGTFSFSPDGHRVMFLDISPDSSTLVLVDTASARRIDWPIQTGPDEETFSAFASDGDHVILKGYGQPIEGHFLELYEVKETLSNPRRIAEFPNEGIYHFSVSPDGGKIAVTLMSGEGENIRQRVLVINLDRPETQMVLERTGPALSTIGTFWSPDGQSLAFMDGAYLPPCPGCDLLVFDTRSGEIHSLLGRARSNADGTTDEERQLVPIGFSPDSQFLAYTIYSRVASDDGGASSFWTTRIDGSHQTQIAYARLQYDRDEVSGEFVVGLSPDWSKVILVVPHSLEDLPLGDMYVATINGNSRVFLDTQVFYSHVPPFGLPVSPDGSRVAYLCFDANSGYVELRTIGIDGSDRRTLVAGDLEDDSISPVVGFPLDWLPAPQ